ncbi:MAG: DUF2868 domain-containing protein [Chromatocurvus sp.]
MTDSALQLLLDFDDRVQRETAQPSDFLHRRDRRFALTCSERGLAADARSWLDHLARLSGAGGSESRGRSVARLWRRIAAGFGVAGGLFGILTMLGLLVYEGGQRINVTVLMAFVLLQLALALLTSLQALLGWQPWRPLLARFQARPPTRALQDMQPLLMARAAHLGGLCFAASALITLLVALVIQDLAFGWSTTLSTVPARFAELVAALSWPWHALWPAAVPDLPLVEMTRFYRAETSGAQVPAARWGDWWPFVMMLWLCYVVLPRAILLLLAQVQIVLHARRALQTHPGWRALQYRMETPTLDTGNEHNDADDLPADLQGAIPRSLPDATIAVYWGGVADDSLPPDAGSQLQQRFVAGGRATLDEDRQTLQQVADAIAQDKASEVLLVTRGWEPPTGELQDFIEAARDLWPPATRLAVVPVAPDPAAPLDRHQLPQWLRLQERFPAGFVSIGLAVPPARKDAGARAHA